MRTAEEKEFIKNNESNNSFKSHVEVYNDKAQMICQRVSKLVWYPNIYNLEKEQSYVFLAGGDGSTTGDGMVDFLFYENKSPFKLY